MFVSSPPVIQIKNKLQNRLRIQIQGLEFPERRSKINQKFDYKTLSLISIIN